MMSSVATVITHHRSQLTELEEVSMRQLRHHLSALPIYGVCPHGVSLGPNVQHVHFPDRYFRDLPAQNWLRLQPFFWRAFTQHEYILIYELDSIVISSDLERFCTGEYDYIGAPWIAFESGRPVRFTGVGNGGLSLRRVGAALSVLTSRRPFMTPREYWQKVGRSRARGRSVVSICGAVSKLLPWRNNVRWYTRQFIHAPGRTWAPHEDKFWSHSAKIFHPEFKVAPVETALAFAFEGPVAFCLKHNGGRAPFGCHKWRYHACDRAYWESHLA
jgi:hypothetical protein